VRYKPGQKVPETGVYQELDENGELIVRDLAHCQQGDRFPPTNDNNHRWVKAMSIQGFRQRITDRRQKQAGLDGRVNTAIDLASTLAKDFSMQFEFFGDIISQAKPVSIEYLGETIPAFEFDGYRFGVMQSAIGLLLIGELNGRFESVALTDLDLAGNDDRIYDLLDRLG
jgi:hypothetical protein